MIKSATTGHIARIVAVTTILTGGWIAAIGPTRSVGTTVGTTVGVLTTGIATVLPECPAEDSTDCVYHASLHGNGVGYDFVNLSGRVITLDRAS